jgi:hypothetical protein
MGRKSMRNTKGSKSTRRHHKTKKGGKTTKRKIQFKLSGLHTDNDIDIDEKSIREASAAYGFSHDPYIESHVGKKAKDSAEVREIQKAKKNQKVLTKYFENIMKKLTGKV